MQLLHLFLPVYLLGSSSSSRFFLDIRDIICCLVMIFCFTRVSKEIHRLSCTGINTRCSFLGVFVSGAFTSGTAEHQVRYFQCRH